MIIDNGTNKMNSVVEVRFDDDGNIVLPVFDAEQGLMCGIMRRIVARPSSDNKKYIGDISKGSLPIYGDIATDANRLVVVEGMMDFLTAATQIHWGSTCTVAGLQNASRGKETAEALLTRMKSLRQVMLVPQNDDPGRAVMRNFEARMSDAGVKVSTLNLPDEFEDLNDWWVKTGGDAELLVGQLSGFVSLH